MDDQETAKRIMLAIGALEKLNADLSRHAQQAAQLPQQVQAAKAELQAARQQEEALLKQSMVALFADLQQKLESAQRRTVIRTWQVFAALGAVFVVLYLGMLLLLKHEYQRLQDAQARADAAEVSAEVRQASQHVVITSCGGRACIQIDKDMPTWKSRGKEYILVDGQSGSDHVHDGAIAAVLGSAGFHKQSCLPVTHVS